MLVLLERHQPFVRNTPPPLRRVAHNTRYKDRTLLLFLLLPTIIEDFANHARTRSAFVFSTSPTRPERQWPKRARQMERNRSPRAATRVTSCSHSPCALSTLREVALYAFTRVCAVHPVHGLFQSLSPHPPAVPTRRPACLPNQRGHR